MLSKQCKAHLMAGEYLKAKRALDDEASTPTENERETVEDLAVVFGDAGGNGDGKLGSLITIVVAALVDDHIDDILGE